MTRKADLASGEIPSWGHGVVYPLSEAQEVTVEDTCPRGRLGGSGCHECTSFAHSGDLVPARRAPSQWPDGESITTVPSRPRTRAVDNATIGDYLMDRMEELEHRSIYIIREAYASFQKPAVLWSMGKDSTALIALCRKAFLGTVPFPVIHIDTGRKFSSMYAFRDKWARAWGLDLRVAQNTTALSGTVDYSDKLACCTALKTAALKQLIEEQSFDAIMLAIRRDEHGVRAKERHFSPRDTHFRWDYHDQPPELWDLFGARADGDTHIRVHPLLDWTELDVWQYIKKENLPIVDLYLSKEGKRYRSIGCEPCCEPIESEAATLDDILHELETTRTGERQGRAQDKEAAYAMQQLRALGYM